MSSNARPTTGDEIAMAASITKETFCKALALIKEQEEINAKFGKALDMVGDGHYVYGANNRYLSAALLVLKEALGDKYDYIEWWLYDTSDYMISSGDKTKSWNLRAPEALYDYILNECK